jgi:hypothetical protein
MKANFKEGKLHRLPKEEERDALIACQASIYKGDEINLIFLLS